MNQILRQMLLLPPQASSFARDIDTLHYVVILTTMVAALVIGVLAVYFAVRYRASRGVRPRADVTTTRKVEFTLVPFTLTVFIVFWVFGFRQFVGMQTPPKDSTVVYVTAKQWMWKFAHEEGPSEVGVLTVPAHRPIKLLLTSRDVIHSFYVPAFRVKQDAVPGRYTVAWFEATEEGRFDLLCAEYCGTSHSTMLGTIVVLSPERYQQWLAGARELEPVSLVEKGKLVAERQQCVGCHTTDGRVHEGPTWRGLFGSQVELTSGRTVVADEAYLTRSMMQPTAEIVAGFRPVMPTYAGRLSAGEAAALVAYIRALGSPESAAAAGAPALASGSLEVDASAAEAGTLFPEGLIPLPDTDAPTAPEAP